MGFTRLRIRCQIVKDTIQELSDLDQGSTDSHRTVAEIEEALIHIVADTTELQSFMDEFFRRTEPG